MKSYKVNLNELDRYRAAHVGLDFFQNVTLAPDPNDCLTLLVYNERGEPCGAVPRRSALCKEILGGARVGHIAWQGFGREANGQLNKLRVRVVLVNEGEHYVAPSLAPAPSRTYPVGIVGESNYQPAIRRCSQGQKVQIAHELGNPYDKDALVVVSEKGDTIGYIGRDSWLQDAIHTEGHGCDASIKGIHNANNGFLGVVLGRVDELWTDEISRFPS